ncbi:(deoxy)nucleoside triphosphate pyrophosphohydrolase [Antarcticibacterium arcticum]|uniref:8-oxo-dGTP diphosphatase n=1 Tax=Antarcticibacterium arcticum TaxID=2585771 RepID=A0A5B8YP36_9FLAO|nr:(deoxy)nucleoside triphosphate pyrophosphohydrolase [Antarcticibacterium arcticum]
MTSTPSVIRVTCAIVENEGKVLCAQRSESMMHPLKWEFPGGKVEGDEDLETCLKREIKEELGVEIAILEQLPSNFHIYSNLRLELIPFRCSLQTFEIDLLEHSQILWLPINELKDLDWAEADVPIVDYYIRTYK